MPIPYKLPNGKVVNVPDKAVSEYMKMFGLTKSQAVEMWLEDEGHLHNEEQEALERKAKENRITATIHEARNYTKKTQRERVKKEDPTKEGVITAIAEILPTVGATDVVIVNSGKIITFRIGNDEYKVDLTRKRPPKDKGKP